MNRKGSDAASFRCLSPISIGEMTLRNRIQMSAMATNFGTSSGEVTQRMIDYYIARAKAEPGMIIVEVASADEGGRLFKYQLSISDDRFKSGLSQLAGAIKQYGVKSAIQIHHGGRLCNSGISGRPPVAPSSIIAWKGEFVHELTEVEIESLINTHAEAAKRAKDCGFDAVEVHFAHGYLGSQFLSPLTNKRRDKYGGDLENRARFCMETIGAARRLVGNDYPLLIRFSAEEHIKGGITIHDGVRIAEMFEAAGVDAIDVSTGYRASSEEGYINCSIPRSIAPMCFPRGCFVKLAEAIKKKVSVPVITVGRINDLFLAERTIMEDKADIVAFGRAFLADPEFLPKWISGHEQDIRRCIACNVCQAFLANQKPIRCAINAELGREEEYKITPASQKRKILVVGGGPAGMEAARVAAMRGHRVTLAEKEDRLGGRSLLAAGKPDFKAEIGTLVEFLATQIEKNRVEIKLNTRVNREFVDCLKPDALILATGAKPITPRIKGIENDIVADAIEVLLDRISVGERVIVVGGGRVGCALAVFLAQKGKKVTIVEIRNVDFGIGEGIAPDEEEVMRKWLLFDLWPALGITAIGNASIKQISDEGAIIMKKNNGKRLIGCNNIIFAIGMTPVNSLGSEINVPEVYLIGDSKEPRTIMEAIHEGAEVGRRI